MSWLLRGRNLGRTTWALEPARSGSKFRFWHFPSYNLEEVINLNSNYMNRIYKAGSTLPGMFKAFSIIYFENNLGHLKSQKILVLFSLFIHKKRELK